LSQLLLVLLLSLLVVLLAVGAVAVSFVSTTCT
jgi:hypothetical protein